MVQGGLPTKMLSRRGNNTTSPATMARQQPAANQGVAAARTRNSPLLTARIDNSTWSPSGSRRGVAAGQVSLPTASPAAGEAASPPGSSNTASAPTWPNSASLRTRTFTRSV